MLDFEREIWRIGDVACLIISCCAGAELQLRRLPPQPSTDYEVLLRELYPTKSDLYERARELEAERRTALPDSRR